MPDYFAHTGLAPDRKDWQALRAHLEAVAEKARERLSGARPGDEALARAAYAAGLLHDLGKYRPEFQAYLRAVHVPRPLTYHKHAGAAKASDGRNWPAALAIAGHHGGLPDGASLGECVNGPSGRAVCEAVWAEATNDCPSLRILALDPPPLPDKLTADLFTRLIFSCLVDADWADTSSHQDWTRNRPSPPPPSELNPAARLGLVLQHIGERSAQCPEPAVAAVRQDVLNACRAAAHQRPGLYSLTVPTGGGKTLSGLAFAMEHAALHGLRRVIYVAPFLSIIDQNARVIREAVGVGPDDPAVFEHHYLAEPTGDDDAEETDEAAAVRRAENWDAPIVITSGVQFFESLFSNKPGRCRKLHNIARSVVLLDECQTLPPELVAPTCSLLGQLTAQLGCTVVLCTATQPAFDHVDMKEDRLRDVSEIAPRTLDLFSRLRRVNVTWPRDADAPLDWSDVAVRMRSASAALCVVSTKRAARELFTALYPGDGVFHLSTAMCPAHRLIVLDEVKRRLARGLPCHLVSTQLIEAGVDVDFPLVLRELAPLEAIIQAAGRCNREGRLRGGDGGPGGQVVVFRSAAAVAEPSKYYPPDRWYKAGRSVLETSFLNAAREPRIDSPDDIREYFERLYRAGELDEKHIQDARRRFAFREVADAYRLIQDDGEGVVVASWKERSQEVEGLLAAVKTSPTRVNFCRLAPFQVNLRRHELARAAGMMGEEVKGLFVWRGGYDANTGLSGQNADLLLIV